MKITNLEVGGIDTGDYPDFCDAYASYAEWEDGTVLTEEELEEIDPYLIHDTIMGMFNNYQKG